MSNREQRGEKATWWQWRIVALSSGGKGRERKREGERLIETMLVCRSDVREKLRAFSVSENFMRLR